MFKNILFILLSFSTAYGLAPLHFTPSNKIEWANLKWIKDLRKPIGTGKYESNPSVYVDMFSGKQYLVKRQLHPNKLMVEWIGYRWFTLLGFNVPKTYIIYDDDGNPVLISEWLGDNIPTLKSFTGNLPSYTEREIKLAFPADVMLVNADRHSNNILLVEKDMELIPYFIDFGRCFLNENIDFPIYPSDQNYYFRAPYARNYLYERVLNGDLFDPTEETWKRISRVKYHNVEEIVNEAFQKIHSKQGILDERCSIDRNLLISSWWQVISIVKELYPLEEIKPDSPINTSL